MPTNRTTLRFSARLGSEEIALDAVRMDNDLTVAIHGGEKSHIGAVAVAQPRPSLADPTVRSATASVIAILGHKEDLVARNVATRISTEIDGVVAVSCGIHYDDIPRAQIGEVTRIVNGLVDDLLHSLADDEHFPPSRRTGDDK